MCVCEDIFSCVCTCAAIFFARLPSTIEIESSSAAPRSYIHIYESDHKFEKKKFDVCIPYCVYLCIDIYIYIYIYIYQYIYIYMCIYSYKYIYTYIYVPSCMYVYMYVLRSSMHIYESCHTNDIYKYISMHVRIHAYIHMHVHTYIYMYIHVYILIHTYM